MKNPVDDIRNLISEDKVLVAIEETSKLFTENSYSTDPLIVLKSELTRLTKNHTNGVIGTKELNINTNSIAARLLLIITNFTIEYADKVPKNIPNSRELSELDIDAFIELKNEAKKSSLKEMVLFFCFSIGCGLVLGLTTFKNVNIDPSPLIAIIIFISTSIFPYRKYMKTSGDINWLIIVKKQFKNRQMSGEKVQELREAIRIKLKIAL